MFAHKSGGGDIFCIKLKAFNSVKGKTFNSVKG
jgi:hypothetical protein